MSPIIGVPILILYFAGITWVPIWAGSQLSPDRGAFAGGVVALILWGVSIGFLMSIDPNFGYYA